MGAAMGKSTRLCVHDAGGGEEQSWADDQVCEA